MQTEVDGAADFAQYQTFNFASPLATERSGQPTPVTEHLQQAAMRQMRPSADAGYHAYRDGAYIPPPGYRDPIRKAPSTSTWSTPSASNWSGKAWLAAA